MNDAKAVLLDTKQFQIIAQDSGEIVVVDKAESKTTESRGGPVRIELRRRRSYRGFAVVLAVVGALAELLTPTVDAGTYKDEKFVQVTIFDGSKRMYRLKLKGAKQIKDLRENARLRGIEVVDESRKSRRPRKSS